MLSGAYESIENLIQNEAKLSESEQLSQLRSILQTNPDVVHEANSYGVLLLHSAAAHSSPRFCKLLIESDADLKSLKTKTFDYDQLPFQYACSAANLETAKYLFHLWPACINIPDDISQYPIHSLVDSYDCKPQEAADLCRFLLKHDRGAVSTPDDNGTLPLHVACEWNNLEIIKLLYNAYPDGILAENDCGQTPLEISSGEVEAFFHTQLDFIHEAQEVGTPDNSGQLPLHRAIKNTDLPVGTIELMIAENPDSALQADYQGLMPLHLAFQAGNLKAIKYLTQKHHNGSFQVSDGTGKLPLHHACRYGRCEVINYIVQKTTEGVNDPNVDGKLPIWSLLLDAPCDRNSLEYIRSVDLLLRACPDELVRRVL